MGAEPPGSKGVGWDPNFAELWMVRGRLLGPRDTGGGWSKVLGVTVEDKLREPMKYQSGRFW